MLSLKNFLQKKILYMEQTEHKKIEFKDKLSLIYKTNKVKNDDSKKKNSKKKKSK